MQTEQHKAQSPFVWMSRGGWLGMQLGGSAWALVGAVELFFRDAAAALVCLVAFAALNAYGLHLWRSRDRLSAYAGIQRLLLAYTLFCAAIIATLNLRGLTDSRTPYWCIAMPPVLMAWFYFQQRAALRRSTAPDGPTPS